MQVEAGFTGLYESGTFGDESDNMSIEMSKGEYYNEMQSTVLYLYAVLCSRYKKSGHGACSKLCATTSNALSMASPRFQSYNETILLLRIKLR